MCRKKKVNTKLEDTSDIVDTSRANKKDPIVEEIDESILEEISYQRFQNMINLGYFDDLKPEEKIKLIKEKSIYINLVQRITSEQKKESTKLITSILTKTITISGFYFAIIAFILTSEFVFTINKFALYLFFGSIIILFIINSLLLPLFFLWTPLKSNSAEFIANLNIIQSIFFLIICISNILVNTFNIENREMWFLIGIPVFILIIFLILIWQIRIRDSKGIEKELKIKVEKKG